MTTGLPLDRRVNAPSKAVAHRLAGVVVDGKYEILKRIGAGGMGEVFEARNILLGGRMVAMKVVATHDLESVVRLRGEASIIAGITHPNICDVYDVGAMPDGSPYLVLERLYGETLEQHLRATGRLRFDRVQDYFNQTLSAIGAAHHVNIVHRDLKPANVFLSARAGCPALVKVLDFGLAKDTTGRLFRNMTRPGRVCGTREYMSPEQLLGAKLDIRSDLFSVGIMMFESLTGTHPFAAKSVLEVASNIMKEEPRFRRHVPPDVEAFLRRALQKNPDHRFSSAREMQAALARLAPTSEDEGPASAPPTRLPRLGSSSAVSG